MRNNVFENRRRKRESGFTLIEVMVVLSLFTTILAITLVTLNTSSAIQTSQQKKAEMQSSSRRLLEDIRTHITEAKLSAAQVDTRMRWVDQPDDEWETYDKFHTWYYKQDNGGDYYPAMVQCPEEFCGWSHDGTNYRSKFAKFTSNFNYHNATDHLTEFHSSTTGTDKGFSRSGRIYNDLYDPKRHSQSGLDDNTTAQCIKGNGATLHPLVQVDVLQFPTPRNLKYDYVTNEGSGRGPDSQGWMIYAPYYDSDANHLEVRRYGLFIRDMFKELPWKSGDESPVYDWSEGAPYFGNNEVDNQVIAVADSVANSALVKSSPYLDDLNEYNYAMIKGSTKPITYPPDWPAGKPKLTHIFDFDENNLIETDVDADGNDQITFGSTREETESVFEQFRLYPSTSAVDTSRYADWTSTADINDVNGLIYHKYSDTNLRSNYDEMEVYYFIDLETGWTRFFYFCSWNGGGDWIYINASFVRRPYEGLEKQFATSEVFKPFQSFGKQIIGLDFSTSKTYPDNIPSGMEPDQNVVRIGLLMDNKMLLNGEFKYPSLRQETMIPLSPK